MNPSILKSLQKIQELVKDKKEIIEQIPLKTNNEQIPQKVALVPGNSQIPLQISSNSSNPLANNQLNFSNYETNSLFISKPATNYMDGLIIPFQNEYNEVAMPQETARVNEKNNLANTNKKKPQEDPLQKAKNKKKKAITLRKIAGETWEDKTLEDWPENDFRIFCGDLGNEVNDEGLAAAFRKYSSFQRARVIRDKRSGKTKGYGFVSLMDPQEYLKALTEMNGKYVGNRPIKVRKSSWKERSLFAGKYNEGKNKKKIKI